MCIIMEINAVTGEDIVPDCFEPFLNSNNPVSVPLTFSEDFVAVDLDMQELLYNRVVKIFHQCSS